MINSKIQIVSTKGQVVIPAEYRKKLHIRPQLKVILRLEPEKKRIILQPIRDPIEELSGILKGKMEKTPLQIKKQIRKEEIFYEEKKPQKIK